MPFSLVIARDRPRILRIVEVLIKEVPDSLSQVRGRVTFVGDLAHIGLSQEADKGILSQILS